MAQPIELLNQIKSVSAHIAGGLAVAVTMKHQARTDMHTFLSMINASTLPTTQIMTNAANATSIGVAV